jgi:hypothetical protein
MIIPTTRITAAAALAAMPSIAAPVKPVVGVLVAISAGVEVASVPVVTVVTVLLDRVLSQGAPLHVVVKNGDGCVVSVPVVVITVPPGSALYSFVTASLGHTSKFGESNWLLQRSKANSLVALLLILGYMPGR